MQPCMNQTECRYKESDYEVLFSSDMHNLRYEFRLCRRCGLIYHHPSPDPSELERRYASYGSYADPAYVRKQLETARVLNMRRAKELSAYLEEGGRKLLEVGCSNGIMLKHLEEYGFDCYGVEIDPASSGVAKGLIGKERIFTGTLGNSPWLDESFDAVICRQTIEHVPNPFETMLHMNMALRDGGILYIETPNFGGPSARLLRDRWKNILPGDHISMFTPSILIDFLTEAGFIVLKRRIGGFAYNMRRDSKGGFERYRNPAVKTFLRMVGVVLRVVNLGDGISVVSRKTRRMDVSLSEKWNGYGRSC